jgi:hypothetical protein
MVLARPALDVLRGLERCATSGRRLLFVVAGLVLAWWAYVPIHELLHALACVVMGGSVTKLEISAVYGGGFLARVFTFVECGGGYAGRLSGFDTGGSDVTYLATDLGPYLLTLFPGVWLLRIGGTARRGWLFGLGLPLALAPFISLTGDAYEIGSILTTRLPPWSAPAARELLRGDDLFRVVTRLHAAAEVEEEMEVVPWMGLACGSLLGAVWAWATYMAGAGVAHLLGRGPVEPYGASAAGSITGPSP